MLFPRLFLFYIDILAKIRVLNVSQIGIKTKAKL